jgi:hypothetical protein
MHGTSSGHPFSSFNFHFIVLPLFGPDVSPNESSLHGPDGSIQAHDRITYGGATQCFSAVAHPLLTIRKEDSIKAISQLSCRSME